MANNNWRIRNSNMVHGGAQRTQLIGCSIRLDTTTNAYGFYGPTGTLEATVAPSAKTGEPVKPPFNFPVFHSALNGTISRDWYILVKDLDNPIPNIIDGNWDNNKYMHVTFGFGETDTFTAQAGVGPEPDPDEDEKKHKEAAAHASTKR